MLEFMFDEKINFKKIDDYPSKNHSINVEATIRYSKFYY